MKKQLNLLSGFLSLFIMITGAFSCKKNANDSDTVYPPYTPVPYSITVPQWFPVPVTPSINPMTVEGVNLGHRFYYDPILSSNGLTCSTCHIAGNSFSSPIFTTNIGELISIPPHINLAWNPDYNWNGSEPMLDHLCLADFGPDFFNTNMDTLRKRLLNHDLYPRMLYEAFGIQSINSISDDELKQDIVYAISQFMRSMVSANSRYDKFIAHQLTLTTDENEGYYIFNSEKGDCFHCHGSPLFTVNTYSNNGLDSILTGQNQGRYLVTGLTTDMGKFSIPTLRNIALTAPYMHDGRYATLQEVIDFYDSGVHKSSPNIDPIMTKPAKRFGLELTAYEKSCLLKFLETLTDTSFIANPAYTNPL